MGRGQAALAAVRTLGIGGLSVTMPHKQDVARAVDQLSPAAQQLSAVNCVVNRGGRLMGENTDGTGFVASLHEALGRGPEGWKVVVLGAGGAARAVVAALAAAGAAEVAVINRTPERAAAAAALAGDRGRVASPDVVADADLVVNATSVGMGAGPTDLSAVPIDPHRLGSGQVVADLVYQPIETPLLRAAVARGATPVDGLGMLVHQAAEAFSLWTGDPAPIAAMRAAAEAALPPTAP